MKAFPWEVLVLAALLAVNRLLVPMTYTRPAAFWAIQAVDVALAVLVAVYGVPGLEAFRSVGWLIAGLLVFHVLQNIALRSQARAKREREEGERERLRKLRSMGEEPRPPAEPPAP
ncbi:MAG: hypothetical protein ACK4YP_07175 [Myxococcota bacterium]